MEKRSPWWSFWGSKNRKYPKSSIVFVITKYSGNPQPRSLRLIMLDFRAKVTQPLLTFGEIVKISPLISKWKSELIRQPNSVVINLKLREKIYPNSSKKQKFWSLQSIQRTHNRDGYAKLSLVADLRRHNHIWHAGDRISAIVLKNRQRIVGSYRGARHTLSTEGYFMLRIWVF